ncbi:hypothetical protein [Pseudomonas typographi]|uniref:Glycosyl transferase family 1 domain-containing protein n=1 Tax=Pseudomonas typographi TaxID=2715964 RepID=A0ABR7ZAN0_9PSED|nr:hypothetical protein [Pseudomonas typographi]MBD1602364.1 hypothetical protein [Pseudomonas typographi]
MSIESVLRIGKATAFELFGAYECRLAMATLRESKRPDGLPLKVKMAFYCLKGVNAVVPLNSLMRQQEKAEIERPQIYDAHLLGLMVNRAYDMPEVVSDPTEPRRINVLVPAFTINTISAGFFGVFNVALFVAAQGYRVRLVLFDNFYYDESEFRNALKKFPSMENLFEKIEVEYIGSRVSPLKVSPFDNCVATVWYSAYFAEKISRFTNGKPFLYLIQDFEAAFYPFNSQYCISRNSYNFNYHTLASSESLLEYLQKGDIISPNMKSIYFENACSSSIFPKEEFFRVKATTKKRFVFYSRPAVNRNMFEMAALALIHAYNNGVFSADEWEFYGMGIGNTVVQLAPGVEVKQLPRMPLDEYEAITKTFDLCLTLMSSPHPSLIPMDLAASGAVVVTNTFETKTSDYLRAISSNILPADPDLYALANAIAEGVLRTNDLQSRWNGATITWPKTWDETWTSQHAEFIHEVFGHDQ